MEDQNNNINNLSNRESIKKDGKLFKNIVLLIKSSLNAQEWIKSQDHPHQVQSRKNVEEKVKNLTQKVMDMDMDMDTGMDTGTDMGKDTNKVMDMDISNIIGDKAYHVKENNKQDKQSLRESLIEWLKDLEVLKNNINNLSNKD